MSNNYSCIVSFHTNPYTCGVARFNRALADEMAIPLLSIEEFVIEPIANALVSVKFDEMSPEATVLLGSDPTKARSWWLGEISRIANDKEVTVTELSITPADVAEIVALVNKGELTDKLARQVVEGVIAGEGTPAEVVAKRGIKVVNDDGALMAAIEKVCADQPDTAQKVRDGHIPAAGALIGAVMKETKGQADAARVRELLLGHLGQASS